MSDRTLTVDGKTITLSHPDKVLFPEHGLSKSDLADYYQRVAPMMLPHLRGRPLTLHRFPDGIGAHGFYQQNRSDHFPDWLPAASIDHPGGTGPTNWCSTWTRPATISSRCAGPPGRWATHCATPA